MSDLSINVGTDGSSLERSNVTIGDVAGRDAAGSARRQNEEIERLQQRVRELEQFVFGDQKLGIMGIRQQLQGQRFWTLFNVALTALLIAYEIFRVA